MNDLQNRSIAVIGLGQSGYESAQFLRKHDANVFVTEKSLQPEMVQKKADLERSGIQVELGSHDLDRILKSDLVVISPGISPKTLIYQEIQKSGIPIWSEIELAFCFCKAPIIAVTGTNGKTTTTTLIAKLINEQGRRAVSCGNIGNPFIGEVENLHASDLAVVEVSSFQLENTYQFRPHIAILLNLSDNHFDWHGTFDAYAKSKWKIFSNQTKSDLAILNQDDSESMKRKNQIRSRIQIFGSGEFNNPNFSACLTVVQELGLDVLTAIETLKNFKGIEHRMEIVPSNDSHTYINDSKSTTIASLKWALERSSEPVILIAGGRHKGGDFKQIEPIVKQKVSDMILIGEATDEMESAFSGATRLWRANNLHDAVRKAKSVSRGSHQPILFSPACASFDMFKNYADRGIQFKNIVRDLQSVNNPKAFID